MLPIHIEVIQHSQQRYETLGDWHYIDGIEGSGRLLLVSVSDTGVAVYNMALAIHELAEAWLCRLSGITVEEVDAWDLAYEKLEYPDHPGLGIMPTTMGTPDEPGDHPSAPYHRQHQMAEVLERAFLAFSGYSWSGYSEACEKVMEGKT